MDIGVTDNHTNVTIKKKSLKKITKTHRVFKNKFYMENTSG